MRALILDHTFRADLLLHAALLNLAWLTLAASVFLLLFRSARARGLLLQVGE
jgi:ABC-2 type transport system permease protein